MAPLPPAKGKPSERPGSGPFPWTVPGPNAAEGAAARAVGCPFPDWPHVTKVKLLLSLTNLHYHCLCIELAR